jgi:hypothetical protein
VARVASSSRSDSFTRCEAALTEGRELDGCPDVVSSIADLLLCNLSQGASRQAAERLPDEAPSSGHRLSFIGIGASGDTRPFDIHRERAQLAERKFAQGI